MAALSTTGDGTRIGLLGYGRWGALVARDLVACGAEVVVCGSGESTARARQAGVTETVKSAAELTGVAGVVICTPTTAHAESIESVAGLGVPIFVEKPMTNDVGAARRLSDELGDRLFVMEKWRYHHGVERLGEIARSGELGAVVGLRTCRFSRGMGHDNVDALWVLMPHELSIGVAILGQQLTPSRAVALRDGDEIHHMEATLGHSPWHQIGISSVASSHRREIELLCEDGAALLEDPYAEHLLVRRYDAIEEAPERISIETEMPLLREMREFVDYVRGTGPEPRASAADGLWAVETVQRLRDLSAPDGIQSRQAP